MNFPTYRARRMRANETVRTFMRETAPLNPAQFIYPLFVKPGTGLKDEIPTMPGVYQYSIDELVKEVGEVLSLGIGAIMLFGLPHTKDEVGSEAYDDHGIVQEAIRAIKAAHPECYVITDVCMCEYTSHGHCGIVDDNGYVKNDETLKLLAAEAVSHVRAGADMVAPSDMMDGRIAALREALDEAGFINVPIMAYSVKYASAYYGPFREAADSAPVFGDRRAYQMDPANIEEALREAEMDVMEGADMLMVKPALAYLDVLREVKQAFPLPMVAYNVSGEYAMVKAAAAAGMVDEKRIVMESLLSMKRAGADCIITYHAKDVARWLQDK